MKNRGFTLVEMIVSLAIFSVVAVIAITALLKVIDANKKAQSIQSSVTNLNFALESMSRDLRTGTDYTCGSSVPGTLPGSLSSTIPCQISRANKYIAFNSSRSASDGIGGSCNLVTAYAFIPDSGNPSQTDLKKAEQMSCNDQTYVFNSLISPVDVSITSYELGVLYSSPGPSYPLAFLRLTGYAGVREQDKTYVDIETAVSARASQ